MIETYTKSGVPFVHTHTRKVGVGCYVIARQRIGKELEFWNGVSWGGAGIAEMFSASAKAMDAIYRQEQAVMDGHVGRFHVVWISPEGSVRSVAGATYNNAMAWISSLGSHPSWAVGVEGMDVHEHTRIEFDGWKWLITRTA